MWNLRVPFPPDAGRNLSWEDRRGSVASAIAAHRPDLLAVQEDCRFMTDDLMNGPAAAVARGTNRRGGGEPPPRLSITYDRYGLFNRNG